MQKEVSPGGSTGKVALTALTPPSQLTGSFEKGVAPGLQVLMQARRAVVPKVSLSVKVVSELLFLAPPTLSY